MNITKYISYLLLVVLMLSNFSCEKATTGSYSFYVAGHTYGFRWVDNKGLHPPFEEKFDLINEREAAFGVLLGDIVFKNTDQDWAEVDSVLSFLNCTTYYAVGNHDLVDPELFEQRYGNTYFSFTQGPDLCIVLDPNRDSWNISGDQLEFLKQTLADLNASTRHIFVFFHQLLWWSNDNKYKRVRVNSKELRAPQINFWSEVIPLFKKTNRKVYMFAGDLGGGNWAGNYFYDTWENFTFIATGMGNDNDDNFIIVNVDEEGTVGFELISLNEDDIHALGRLEDYTLPEE